uniref:Secreted protein n=1 Tax=Eutreptiella gymnastica TaxID=73025 RepID=A0A7S1IZ74_9EUGL|mmetsp:Transcript_53875/g.95991  ORF Transcript_53875/g.95991 Transcript_53875/m.95991 type:complete len:122 (+) Transcript_53875:758-1123(+)
MPRYLAFYFHAPLVLGWGPSLPTAGTSNASGHNIIPSGTHLAIQAPNAHMLADQTGMQTPTNSCHRIKYHNQVEALCSEMFAHRWGLMGPGQSRASTPLQLVVVRCAGTTPDMPHSLLLYA